MVSQKKTRLGGFAVVERKKHVPIGQWTPRIIPSKAPTSVSVVGRAEVWKFDGKFKYLLDLWKALDQLLPCRVSVIFQHHPTLNRVCNTSLDILALQNAHRAQVLRSSGAGTLFRLIAIPVA